MGSSVSKSGAAPPRRALQTPLDLLPIPADLPSSAHAPDVCRDQVPGTRPSGDPASCPDIRTTYHRKSLISRGQGWPPARTSSRHAPPHRRCHRRRLPRKCLPRSGGRGCDGNVRRRLPLVAEPRARAFQRAARGRRLRVPQRDRGRSAHRDERAHRPRTEGTDRRARRRESTSSASRSIATTASPAARRC